MAREEQDARAPSAEQDARAPSAAEDDRPELLVKLQERRERHQQRGRVARAGVVVLGVLLVLVGIVLSGPGVPGPGFAVILVGLGFLALEFDRAERLLERVILWADSAKDRVERAPAWQKRLATALGLLVVAACVAAALLWDIPLAPV